MRWLAPLFGTLLWGCAGVADYSTAKMLPRGGFEAAPHATGFGVYVPDEFHGDAIRQIWSAGALAGYGLTGNLDLFAAYEYTRFDFSDRVISNRDQRLALAIKYGWDPLHEALAFGYGYHPENQIQDFTVISYSNWYWKRSLYYCLSPSITFFSDDLSDGNEMAFNAVINQSVTWEFGRHFYLRPQVGFNFIGLFARVILANAGLAAGVAF